MKPKSHDRDFLTAFLKQWRKRLGLYSILAAIPAVAAVSDGDVFAMKGEMTEGIGGEQVEPLADHRGRNYSKPYFLKRQGNFRLRIQPAGPSLAGLLAGTDNCPGSPVPTGSYTAAAPYTDNGDTTGANNTVTRAHYIFYSYYWYDVAGPDQIYSFVITGRGPNPRIEVVPVTTAYAPAAYITDGRPASGCPAGTGNFSYANYVHTRASAGGTAILDTWQMNFVPLNVPLHLFVDSLASGTNGSGAYTLKIQDLSIGTHPRAKYDFSGDGRADITVYRPSEGTWYVSDPPAGFSKTQFGASTDRLVPADYDNDGKTDIAIFRDGQWWLLYSGDSTIRAIQFGLVGDVPVPADYTSDGRSEIAVYRNGQWWILDLATGQHIFAQFGQAGDIPVVGNYDFDSRIDLGIFREGQWYIYGTNWGLMRFTLGQAGDIPVPADYDGDSAVDPSVYRGGMWLQYLTTMGNRTISFGDAGDIPVPADYDGDGRTDPAFFRNGVWHVDQTAGGMLVRQFGLPDDKPAIATP